jgi:hypothetical protein
VPCLLQREFEGRATGISFVTGDTVRSPISCRLGSRHSNGDADHPGQGRSRYPLCVSEQHTTGHCRTFPELLSVEPRPDVWSALRKLLTSSGLRFSTIMGMFPPVGAYPLSAHQIIPPWAALARLRTCPWSIMLICTLVTQALQFLQSVGYGMGFRSVKSYGKSFNRQHEPCIRRAF